LSVSHSTANEKGFSFLLISDVPYTTKQESTLMQTIVPTIKEKARAVFNRQRALKKKG